MSVKYRDHRGSLAESMETTQEFNSKWELYHYLLSDSYIKKFDINNLSIQKYCFDKRIDWNTYIVTIEGFGVVGFTDGELL